MSSITRDNFDRFKKEYEKALKEGKELFQFEGYEVLTSYAKYAVEYVESTYGKGAHG